jgi:hypothetical protein
LALILSLALALTLTLPILRADQRRWEHQCADDER